MALTKTKKSVIDVSSIIGGNNSHVQFNNNDDFGYSDDFIWDNVNKILYVKSIKVGSIGSNPFGGRKNMLINGGFDIWQRGTIQRHDTSENNNWMKYLADMFRTYRGNNYGVDFTVSQSNDVPSLSASNNYTKSLYSYKINCETPATPTVDNDGVCLQYVAEGSDFKTYCNTYNTLSFWAKSNKTGTYCVTFQTLSNNGVVESIVESFSIDSINQWEYKTITIDSSKFNMSDVNIDDNAGFKISIWFAYTNTINNTSVIDISSKSVPILGDYRVTTEQTNLFNSKGNYMNLSQIQFERGNIATPFEYRTYSSELQDCQRYCRKSYPVNITPGTSGVTVNKCVMTQGENPHSVNDEDDIIVGNVNFPVTMRTTPEITIYRPSTGEENKIEDIWGYEVNGNVSLIESGPDGISVIKLDTAHQFKARVPYQFHYLAEANFTS